MATAAILGAQAHKARERTMEVVAEHGRPERLETLQNMTVAAATTRNPETLNAFVAETFAALAEIVGDQAGRISELAETVEDQGRRIAELEKAPAPTTAAGAKAKKTGKVS